MKIPEYSINQPIQVDKDTEFPAGTLVFPFWNEHYIPEHKKEILTEANRYSLSRSKYILCVIGTYWVAIKEEQIRRRDFG